MYQVLPPGQSVYHSNPWPLAHEPLVCNIAALNLKEVSISSHRSGVYALTHGITNGKFGNQKLVAMASSLFQKEEKIDSKR